MTSLKSQLVKHHQLVTYLSSFMMEALHAIKVVTRRTGLTAHVIRIWEKRYGAVVPERTSTNRRLYTDEQIDRLSLLREVTQNGHSIGNVVKLPTEKLRELSKETPSANGHAPRALTASPTTAVFLDECVTAVKSLDSHALEDVLKRAAIKLGAQGLLQRVVAPLAQIIGDLWSEGTITAAHEHFASSVIRIFLGHAARPFAGTDNAPVIVVATPTGQIHELGALLVGAAAANLGWHVIYLGASLPAAEIAGVAHQKSARAVAMSLVYPDDDPYMEGELTRLHESLPPDVMLLVGGRAMPSYRDVLKKIGALQMTDIAQLSSVLNELRKTAKKDKR